MVVRVTSVEIFVILRLVKVENRTGLKSQKQTLLNFENIFNNNIAVNRTDIENYVSSAIILIATHQPHNKNCQNLNIFLYHLQHICCVSTKLKVGEYFKQQQTDYVLNI